MNLMNMVRLCGLVLIGWIVTALGVGMCQTNLRPPVETQFFLPEPALHDAVAISRSQFGAAAEYRLVDRSTGKDHPLPLPEDATWGFVTVSPWRDSDGNLEAVGRWSRPAAAGEQSFYGLGLFRVSDSKVVRSIDLDVLPTGKPCWVPGSTGDVLFPAGDGQLYRCRLTRDRNATARTGEATGIHASSSRSAAPYPVTWRCAVPGSGRVFIADPVWPPDKPLRSFVFVSLSLQSQLHGKPRNDPAQIWWLEMSEPGDEILCAGRLTVPAARSGQERQVFERTPSVSVDPAGQPTLAYLARTQGDSSWRLCTAALSFDHATGKPKIAGVPAPAGEATGCLLPAAPTFSTDGQFVFASAGDGRIKKYSVPSSPARRKPTALH